MAGGARHRSGSARSGQPAGEQPAANHHQQQEGEPACEADRVDPRQEVAALERRPPHFRKGHQRIHRIERTLVVRIAHQRTRLEVHRQVALLEGPALPAILTAIHAAMAGHHQGHGRSIGRDAADPRTGLGQRLSDRAPGGAEIVADINGVRPPRPRPAAAMPGRAQRYRSACRPGLERGAAIARRRPRSP